MSNKKSFVKYDSVRDFAINIGFTEIEAEILVMKGTILAFLDKERERRDFNNTEFATFLEIPKSRWSSILSHPEKVTIDYLLTLAAKCGAIFKLIKRAA